MTVDQFCFGCVRRLLRVVAVFIVMIAVVISVLRYSLPHIDSWRNDIQTWVREAYGADVFIGKITAGWDTTGPAIILNDISFQPDNLSPVDLIIGETRIKLDFWQTLLKRELTSDYFILDDVTVTIDGTSLPESRARDTARNNVKAMKADSAMVDALSRLFLQQLHQFSVMNSEVAFNLPDGQRGTVIIEELEWWNNAKNHHGVGEFSINGFKGNSLNFVLSLEGNELKELDGQLYIAAENLDIGSWLNRLVPALTELESSDINFQVWADIQQGQFIAADILPGKNALAWLNDDEPALLTLTGGQVSWRPTTDGWSVRGINSELSSNGQAWPELDVRYASNPQRDTLYINQLGVAPLAKLASLIASNVEIKQWAEQLQPDGTIKDIWFTPGERMQVMAELSAISWNNAEGIPGVQGLDGDIGLASNSGWLSLSSADGSLLTGDMFRQAISYNLLNIDLSFFQRDDIWHIQGERVWITNNDLDFSAEFALSLDEVPRLDLYGELQGPDVAVARNYYPADHMTQNLIDYLNRSLKSGELGLSRLLLSGPLSAFPFEQQQGIFLVDAAVQNAEYEFAPSWPAISDLNAQLLFKNDELDIYSKHGDLSGIELASQVSAHLKPLSDLRSVIVDVDVKAEAPLLDAMLHKSSVADTVGSALDVVKISGEVTGKTIIDVAVDERDTVDVRGEVVFSGNTINLTAPTLTLTDVTGKLTFNNDHIQVTGLNADLWTMPIDISVEGKDADIAYELDISVLGDWETDALFKQYPTVLTTYLTGNVPFQMYVDVDLPAKGFQYTATLDADMTNVESRLPGQYKKAKGEKTRLTSVVKGDELSNLITAQYNSQLHFNAILASGDDTFSRAQLTIGNEDIGLPGQGFNIYVDLPDADFDTWFTVVDPLVSENSGGSADALLGEPGRVYGKLGKLDFYGQRFNGVNFEATNRQDNWLLNMTAKEARARVVLNQDWNGEGLTVDADYFQLNLVDEGSAETTLDSEQFIASFPPVRFTCGRCQYDDYVIGNISGEIQPEGKELLAKNVVVNNGRHQLRFDGSWQGETGKSGSSNFTGQLDTNDIGTLLTGFGFTSTIKDSNADVDFNLNWVGAPHEFNSHSLGGIVDWKLGEGHLAEVSDKGAKIFSILSLDSILRKLRLDFRDIFSKGLYYNSISGRLTIQDGVAHTDDTKMDGLAGDMTIAGTTNLVNQELDYQLAFKPKVTSSLPVIVAWMVNPVSGLAALALDKVIEDANVISQIQFVVKGTIEEPNVIEVDRRSKEIKIPTQLARPEASGAGEAKNNTHRSLTQHQHNE